MTRIPTLIRLAFASLAIAPVGGCTDPDVDTTPTSTAANATHAGSGPSSTPTGTGLGSSDATDTLVAPAPKEPKGACELSKRIGGFVLDQSNDQYSVAGQVFDTIDPIKAWTLVKTHGECELRRRENPVCDPPCQSSQRCNLEGQCIPAPRAQDLGTVRVWGLKTPVRMTPRGSSFNYFNTELPNPAFDFNQPIGLTSDAQLWPLELWAKGVAPLVVQTTQVKLSREQDLQLKWEPLAAGDAIHVRLNVDQHGTSPLFLRCKAQDTGQLNIPSSLIHELLNAGVSGFPSLYLTRQRGDSVQMPQGCVDFVVAQKQKIEINTYWSQ